MPVTEAWQVWFIMFALTCLLVAAVIAALLAYWLTH